MKSEQADQFRLRGRYKLRPGLEIALAVLQIFAVLGLAFTPNEFELFRAIAFGLAMLIAGIFLSEHAPFWKAEE